MTDTRDMIDAAQARAFFETLFGPFDIPDSAAGMFAVRAVGEKHTDAEGVLRSSEWTDASERDLQEKLARWAAHNGGAFVVPAYVRGEVDAPSNIHETDVMAFTALLVDLDRGDPMAALKHASGALGAPTMVVESGGRLESGKPKLHAWWCFTEPCDGVRAIADARELLAAKLGGDPSFGRIPQIVRIPGSVHLKGGVASPVRIVHKDQARRYDADELIEKIHDVLSPAPGCEESFRAWERRKSGQTPGSGPTLTENGGLSFSPENSGGAGARAADTRNALVSDIHEGGDEDRSRWSEFSKVAGHHIHCARLGEYTVSEALALTGGWVLEHMVPPWPEARVTREFMAILNRDIQAKGLIAAPSENQRSLIITAPDGSDNPQPENPLLTWSPARWTALRDVPERKWLVKGLVPARKPCAFVAEGGAGKTYMSLDLALKLAGGNAADPEVWMGEEIPADAYGTVVVITAEDDKDELAIRLSEIDSKGLRFAAGERLIVLPLLDVGGTFPLVTSRRVHKQGVTIDEHGPTEKWDQLLTAMRTLPDLKLVVIDTLNSTMHGDENSATVVQEYFRQATRICGELGAAVMVTHHLKKQNPKDPIITLDDAASAFRGSEAIKASVRQVITMWHAHDFKSRMERMGVEPKPKTLYRVAVTKANNREALHGIKTLMRTEAGTLEDVTHRMNDAQRKHTVEARAWLLKAVQMAAEAGRPYAPSKSSQNNPANRAGELPAPVRKWQARSFETTLSEMIQAGLLVRTAKGYLDVPGGPLAAGIITKVETVGAYRAPDWSQYEFDPMEAAIVKTTGHAPSGGGFRGGAGGGAGMAFGPGNAP